MSRAEALAHLRAGRPQAAAEMLESRLRVESADAESWFLLGACRHTLNDLGGAAAAFSRSLELDPANPQAHLALVTVLRAAGDARVALAAAHKYLVQLPNDARASYAAALSSEDLGQPDVALAHYDRALGIASDFEDALHNRGVLLARLGRLEEAEANQRGYIAAHPKSARAHSGLVDILLALGRFDEALKALDELPSGELTALLRRGVALASLRRYAQARRIFAGARERDAQSVAQYLERIAPGSDPDLMLSPENLFFWQANLAQRRCDWTSWDSFIAEMRRLAVNSNAVVEPAVAFMAFHLPLSGEERHAIARHVAAGFEAGAPAMPAPTAQRRSRVRVGVLSPDLREHLNAYLLLPLFELLDRNRFELHAYSLAPDDGSAIRAGVRAASEHFRDLHATSDHDAALAIRADELDILVDAAGHTTGARFAIAARRPARIQANYLGFAGSLGSRRVDYAIVDRIVAPDANEWSESLVYLPHTYYLYDFRMPVPELPLSRADYALPEDTFVFCAFHKPEKITPDAFGLWMEILRRVPRSVLWFLALSAVAKENLCREAALRGVDPSRLIFAPFEARTRYLARQRLGDLMLDSVHHSAMTTACDALGCGLPMLTMRGATMASRAGESLLRAAGLPELVVDREAYVKTAVQLGSGELNTRMFRERLVRTRNTAPLFDTAGRVRELEACFEEMIRVSAY